mmetsp:Transcript_41026/g.91755  ORF Transcript_41026/g.91755 Transcript_41026/m.91755 type:complete len:83 (+) Transcript_41026:710-958(+)
MSAFSTLVPPSPCHHSAIQEDDCKGMLSRTYLPGTDLWSARGRVADAAATFRWVVLVPEDHPSIRKKGREPFEVGTDLYDVP